MNAIESTEIQSFHLRHSVNVNSGENAGYRGHSQEILKLNLKFGWVAVLRLLLYQCYHAVAHPSFCQGSRQERHFIFLCGASEGGQKAQWRGGSVSFKEGVGHPTSVICSVSHGLEIGPFCSFKIDPSLTRLTFKWLLSWKLFRVHLHKLSRRSWQEWDNQEHNIRQFEMFIQV